MGGAIPGPFWGECQMDMTPIPAHACLGDRDNGKWRFQHGKTDRGISLGLVAGTVPRVFKRQTTRDTDNVHILPMCLKCRGQSRMRIGRDGKTPDSAFARAGRGSDPTLGGPRGE